MNDLDGKNEADSAVFDRYYTTVLSAAMSGKPVGTLDNAAACIDISIGVTDLALRARSEYLAGKENQKIEKAVKTPPEHSPVIIIRNALRDEVEKRTDGAVTVLYDDHELPSYMLIVPAFDVETVDSVLGRGRHPAFIVGGREVKEIFIGLKPATLIGAVAYCLPSRDRLYSITFDKAREVCNKKGKGWHMLNNWEYAALIMFLVKTNFKHFVRCWWEWVDGLKLVDGGFYFPRNNDFDKPESEWEYQRVCLDDDGYGAPMLSASVMNYTENKGSNNHGEYTYIDDISDLKKSESYFALSHEIRQRMAQLLIDLAGTSVFSELDKNTNDLSARNYGERVPLRGGGWSPGSAAGLAALYLNNARSVAGNGIGCRPAFIA